MLGLRSLLCLSSSALVLCRAPEPVSGVVQADHTKNAKNYTFLNTLAAQDRGEQGRWVGKPLRPEGSVATPLPQVETEKLAACDEQIPGHSNGGTMVSFFSSTGYSTMTKNFICSLHRAGIQPDRYLVLSYDAGHCTDLQAWHPGIGCLVVSSFNADGVNEFGDADYKQMMKVRPRWLQHLLSKGINILAVDTDMVFKKDPTAFLLEQSHQGADLLVQGDGKNEDDVQSACGGFMFFSANGRAAKAQDRIVEFMEHNPTYNDQHALDYITQNPVPDFSIKVLDRYQFPNGKLFFEQNNAKCSDAFIVHNNWIVGHDQKIERFKQHSLWFLGEDGKCSA